MYRSSKFLNCIFALMVACFSGLAWSSDFDRDLFSQHEITVSNSWAELIPASSLLGSHLSNQAVPREGKVSQLLALSSIPVAELVAMTTPKQNSLLAAKTGDDARKIQEKPEAVPPAVADTVAEDIQIQVFEEPFTAVDAGLDPSSEELAAILATLEAEWQADQNEKLAELVETKPSKKLLPSLTARDSAVTATKEVSESKKHALTCIIEPCLRLFQDPKQNQWLVEPKRLDITPVDEQVQVVIEEQNAPLIFVRDQGILEWDAEHRQLHIRATGATELYVVDDQKMLIVPITIHANRKPAKDKNTQNLEQDLLADSALVTLKPLSGLSYGPSKRLLTRNMGRSGLNDLQVQAFSSDGKALNPAIQHPQTNYGLIGLESQRKKVVIQLIDERSVVEAGKFYPVKDARVRVLGTKWQGLTDVRGTLELHDVPEGSRLLLQVDHKGGQIPVHTFEIYVDYEEGVQLERFKVMTYRSFFLYSQIFQVAQHSELSSVCLELRASQNREPLTGVQVAINGEADGPFYFNRFGPDPHAVATDESGRFCLFNVDPGLRELSFYQNGEYLSSVAVPLLAGSHLDDTAFLWNGPSLELRLAAMPTALEQLYSDFDRYMTFHDVDFVNMISVGANDDLVSKEWGVMYGEQGYSWYRGKLYLLAQAPEFESALFGVTDHNFDSAGRLMAPLLPRGFVEDLYHELYLAESQMVEAFDSALGSALVLFGQSEEEQKERGQIKIRLVNQYGREAKDGWYFGSGVDGLTKVMFFNLQPGIYSVIVESQDGVLLDMETVAVDYWTTSLVQTGHVLGELQP